jgi:hypothetical protein
VCSICHERRSVDGAALASHKPGGSELGTAMCAGAEPRYSCALLCVQVLGHTKTILVLLASWWVFQEQMTSRKLAGMSLAVMGMVLYGWICSRSTAKAAAAAGSGFPGRRGSAASRSPSSRRVGKQAVTSGVGGVEGGRSIASHPIRLTDDGHGLLGREVQQEDQQIGSSIAAGVVRRHRAIRA